MERTQPCAGKSANFMIIFIRNTGDGEKMENKKKGQTRMSKIRFQSIKKISQGPCAFEYSTAENGPG